MNINFAEVNVLLKSVEGFVRHGSFPNLAKAASARLKVLEDQAKDYDPNDKVLGKAHEPKSAQIKPEVVEPAGAAPVERKI